MGIFGAGGGVGGGCSLLCPAQSPRDLHSQEQRSVGFSLASKVEVPTRLAAMETLLTRNGCGEASSQVATLLCLTCLPHVRTLVPAVP